jgi:hypothetical protein
MLSIPSPAFLVLWVIQRCEPLQSPHILMRDQMVETPMSNATNPFIALKNQIASRVAYLGCGGKKQTGDPQKCPFLLGSNDFIRTQRCWN